MALERGMRAGSETVWMGGRTTRRGAGRQAWLGHGSQRIVGRIPGRTLGTTPPPSPPRPGLSPAWTTLLASSTFALGVLSAMALTRVQLEVVPPPAPPPLAADSEEGRAWCARIEEDLQHLPLVQTLKKRRDLVQSRPYGSLSPERRANSLTAGVLSGPGKFAARPVIFATPDNRDFTIVLHVGRSLCGHDGIVHGGLLATILDEATARAAVPNLPNELGVTASLKITYKAPAKADAFYVVKSHSQKVEGRKSWATARIEDMTGKTIAEAEALFIEPKWAALVRLQKIETSL